MTFQINQLENLRAIEYNRKFYVAKRNDFDKFIGRKKFDYLFPKYISDSQWSDWLPWNWGKAANHTYILPIDRVEISCLVNETNKIIFKSKFEKNDYESLNTDFETNSIIISDIETKEIVPNVFYVENNIGKTKFDYTGNFEIVTKDLENGDFKIKYEAHDNTEIVSVGVRCFVRPKHLPKIIETIKQLKNDLDEEEKYINKLSSELKEDETKMSESKTLVENLETGLYDETKDTTIVELLKDLKYSFEDFIDILYSLVYNRVEQENLSKDVFKNDILWLRDNIKDANNCIIETDIDPQITESNVIKENSIDHAEKKKKFKKLELSESSQQETKRLFNIIRKCGLKFENLNKISNFLLNSSNDNNFIDALKKKESLYEEVKSELEKSKENFEKHKWSIPVIKNVVEVLKCSKIREYNELLETERVFNNRKTFNLQVFDLSNGKSSKKTDKLEIKEVSQTTYENDGTFDELINNIQD